MEISRPQIREIGELLEDTIEYYCDNNMMSGELAWTVVECFAKAKQAELRGEVAVG
jgi:hypothetical protein